MSIQPIFFEKAYTDCSIIYSQIVLYTKNLQANNRETKILRAQDDHVQCITCNWGYHKVTRKWMTM